MGFYSFWPHAADFFVPGRKIETQAKPILSYRPSLVTPILSRNIRKIIFLNNLLFSIVSRRRLASASRVGVSSRRIASASRV